MAQALAARGHDVHVLDCNPWTKSIDEKDEDVTLHRRRTLRVRGFRHVLRWASDTALPTVQSWSRDWNRQRFQSQNVLRRVLNAFQYYHAYRGLRTRFDVVESPGLSLELFFGLLQATPLVVNLHTPPGFERTLERGALRLGARLANELDRASAFRANLLTSGSRSMVQTLRNSGWLNSHEPWVVPLTMDASTWASLPSPLDTGPVVLTVGRLDYRKAPDVLVQAAAGLGQEIEGLEVVFVGNTTGPNEFRDRVLTLATRIGAPCRFEGQITHEELLSRYASARVVAVPSRSESFSLAGLEAMAAGRPIVCTSRVGLAEWVDGTGAGTVVAPEDPAALADGLRPYLEDQALAAKAGEASRDVVRTRLAPGTVASAREAAYEEAIRRWSRQRKRVS
jgi:glycosyltransferase involved in cell wall biosynthesis